MSKEVLNCLDTIPKFLRVSEDEPVRITYVEDGKEYTLATGMPSSRPSFEAMVKLVHLASEKVF